MSQAQLGGTSASLPGGYVGAPVPKQMLWKQALAQFLGNTASTAGENAATALTTPTSESNPDGSVSFDPTKWYQRNPTATERADVSAANARRPGIVGQSNLSNEQAAMYPATTEAEINKMGTEGAENLSRAGYFGGETQNLAALQPGEIKQQAAQTAATQAGAGLTSSEAAKNAALTPFIGPEAEANIAHTKGETSLFAPTAQRLTNEAGQSGGMAGTMFEGIRQRTATNYIKNYNLDPSSNAAKAVTIATMQEPLPTNGDTIDYMNRTDAAAKDAMIHPEKYMGNVQPQPPSVMQRMMNMFSSSGSQPGVSTAASAQDTNTPDL